MDVILTFGGYWRFKDVPAGSLILWGDNTLALVSEYGNPPLDTYLQGSGKKLVIEPDSWVMLLEVNSIDIEKFKPFPSPVLKDDLLKDDPVKHIPWIFTKADES